MNEFDPLKHPVCLSFPQRITTHSGWHENIPFAMWLVDILKPKIIVELGTYYGNSYCAFCQAVHELDLETRCYAIDTWQGDIHHTSYNSEALINLRTYHDPLYSHFSTLIQSTFNEALERFADGTIDLLHIDGCHTYEAVKSDFELWLPKISSAGIILFHDINVLRENFGVWRFWAEIKEKYPYFEFSDINGIGLLAVGNNSTNALKSLFDATDKDKNNIRIFFSILGRRINMEIKVKQLNIQIKERDTKIKALEMQIQEAQNSIVIQLIKRYQKIVDRVFRRGSRLRQNYENMLANLRTLLNK